MINVNIELFKRTTPVKKIEIIENLTQTELGRVTEETILKIVKETGRRRKGTRDYEFYINPDRRKGNNWNSVVEGLWLYKGKLSVMVYVQFDNTDTSLIVPFQYFFKKGDFRGTVKRDDHYGNPQTHYYVYDEKDRQKSLLVAVLTMKNTFKQVFQVILRIYIVQLTAFYQGEDECRVFCGCLTSYIHTVLEQQLYRFHPLLTEVVRDFR